MPVVITAFADKSFKYVMKTPPASYFIKKVGFSLIARKWNDGFCGAAASTSRCRQSPVLQACRRPANHASLLACRQRAWRAAARSRGISTWRPSA